MKQPLRSNLIFWLCTAYIVGYAALYYFGGYAVSAYVLAALLFGIAFVVLYDWALTGIAAFRSGGREGSAILAFSMCIIAVYALHTRIWAMLKLAWGSPEWMDTSWMGQLAAVWLLMFFSGVVLSTGTQMGEIPKRTFVQYAIAIFIAGMFLGASIMLALRPGFFPHMNSRMVSPAGGSNLPRLTCPGERPVVVPAYCRRVAAQ